MKQQFFLLPFIALPFFLAPAKSIVKPKIYWPEKADACNAPAPSSTSTVLIDSGIAQISWAEVSGISLYQLSVTDNGAPLLSQLVTGSTTYILSGLVAGHIYHYTVRGMCDGVQASSFIIGMDIMP